MHEILKLKGRYEWICHDRYGNEKWRETIHNLVTTQGKNYALNTFLGSGTGGIVYMGLISSVSYSAVAAGDTAAQINGSNGWKEANTGSNFPTYSGNRKAMSFGAASAGSIAASAVVFSMTGTGTVEGAFYCIGSAATPGDTTGSLVSEAAFGSARSVTSGDAITVNYTASM